MESSSQKKLTSKLWHVFGETTNIPAYIVIIIESYPLTETSQTSMVQTRTSVKKTNGAMMKPPQTVVKYGTEHANFLAVCSLVFFVFLVAVLLVASDVWAKPVPQEPVPPAGSVVDQPVELGNVDWQRDLQDAVLKSEQQNKPIAILFQEVPG